MTEAFTEPALSNGLQLQTSEGRPERLQVEFDFRGEQTKVRDRLELVIREFLNPYANLGDSCMQAIEGMGGLPTIPIKQAGSAGKPREIIMAIGGTVKIGEHIFAMRFRRKSHWDENKIEFKDEKGRKRVIPVHERTREHLIRVAGFHGTGGTTSPKRLIRRAVRGDHERRRLQDAVLKSSITEDLAGAGEIYFTQSSPDINHISGHRAATKARVEKTWTQRKTGNRHHFAEGNSVEIPKVDELVRDLNTLGIEFFEERSRLKLLKQIIADCISNGRPLEFILPMCPDYIADRKGKPIGVGQNIPLDYTGVLSSMNALIDITRNNFPSIPINITVAVADIEADDEWRSDQMGVEASSVNDAIKGMEKTLEKSLTSLSNDGVEITVTGMKAGGFHDETKASILRDRLLNNDDLIERTVLGLSNIINRWVTGNTKLIKACGGLTQAKRFVAASLLADYQTIGETAFNNGKIIITPPAVLKFMYKGVVFEFYDQEP